MIVSNLSRQRSIQERNRIYVDKKVFKRELVVGVHIGLFVDQTKSPLPIFFSPQGIELYNRAMLVASSPMAQMADARLDEMSQRPGSAKTPVAARKSSFSGGKSPFSSALKSVQFHSESESSELATIVP
jgi:hypothetical protein